MRVDDLLPLGIFAGLSQEQVAQLLDDGTEVQVEPGAELFRAGEHADFWWLLVDGVIELVRHVGGQDTVVGRMDVPGRWAGGFRAWDEHGVYLATGRGVAPGRVLRVPAEALRARSDAWFPFAGHLIQGVYVTARSIESTARQRESLVTLGTLAAGLAHELNNPSAAAMRSVDALEQACDGLLSSLGRLAAQAISAEQFVALDALRQEVQPAPAHDALAAADAEEVLGGWLVRHGVARDWLVGPALAAAGVDTAWCERVAGVLGEPALGPGLEWVANTAAVTALLAEVKDSTQRITHLVAAVRSYSQLDRAARQLVDVTEGLDSTLIMLGHTLRSVEVVRRYEPDVPRIEAQPGELNQVWTNLIGNALDAMGGRGVLRVSTRREGDTVLVEIGDTGPGMTPAVAARAFEAFYTTKDVGKGTGLGLDIARRIVVERHHGDITITSAPGETVLAVRLPVRPPHQP